MNSVAAMQVSVGMQKSSSECHSAYMGDASEENMRRAESKVEVWVQQDHRV